MQLVIWTGGRVDWWRIIARHLILPLTSTSNLLTGSINAPVRLQCTLRLDSTAAVGPVLGHGRTDKGTYMYRL